MGTSASYCRRKGVANDLLKSPQLVQQNPRAEIATAAAAAATTTKI